MGQTFRPEDLLELPRPGVPVASPNGTFAVYSSSTYNIQQDKTVRNLYLLNIQTKAVQTLTEPSFETSDSEPFFLDNDHLAYIHHQAEKKVDQIYVLNLQERKSYPLTDFPIAFGNVKYNIEHRLLAFSAAVYAEGSLKGTAQRDKEIEDTKKDTGLVFDQLMVRHWDSFVEEKKNNLFVVSLAYEEGHYKLSSEPLNLLKNSALESPLFPSGDASDYDISPDATQIAFLAKTPERDNAWQTTAYIYLVSTKGGSPQQINHLPAASSSPYFTPTGQLAYFQMKVPQYEADRNRITLYDLQSQETREIASDWDSSPSEILSDGHQLFVTAVDQGHQKIFAIDLQTEAIRCLSDKHSASGLQLLGNKLFFGLSSMQHPTQPRLLDLQSNQLIKFGQDLDFGLSSPEEIRFQGANDEQVHGWYLKPADFDPSQKYPVAFLIHGGPQSAWVDSWSTRWNPQIFASAGYAVVAINFHGSTGYGQAFTDSIGENWGSLPYEDLQTGLDYVLSKYSYLDAERVAGLGASYGGYMVNWLNGHSDKFKVFVNHDGVFSTTQVYYTTDELYFPEKEFGGSPIHPENREKYEKYSPANFVQHWKTPTLLIHGGRDFRLTLGESLSAFTVLQKRNIPSRLLYFPDENHWVLKPANSLRWHKEVLDWINQYTKETSTGLHLQQ
ncbi:unnamed protein product [Rhizopus stolonifer]